MDIKNGGLPYDAHTGDYRLRRTDGSGNPDANAGKGVGNAFIQVCLGLKNTCYCDCCIKIKINTYFRQECIHLQANLLIISYLLGCFVV